MNSLFQTIALQTARNYDMKMHKEFVDAVNKIMESDEYQQEHDEQSLKIALDNKGEIHERSI